MTKPKPKLNRDLSAVSISIDTSDALPLKPAKKATKATPTSTGKQARKTADGGGGGPGPGTGNGKKRKVQVAGLDDDATPGASNGPGITTPGGTARKAPLKTQPKATPDGTPAGASNTTTPAAGSVSGSTKTTSKTTSKKDGQSTAPKKAKKSEAKPKGPVDVERQCGVPLPQGGLCARSLTCKSHSMGSKRAVAGRSQPYDLLLAQYQKKNHAKLSLKAAADQAFQDTDEGLLPVDSDEEVAAVMEAVARATGRSAQMKALMPVRRRHRFLKMREVMSTALRPGQSGNLASHGKFIPFHCT